MEQISNNTVDILALHGRARARVRNERIGNAAAGLVLSGAAALSGRGGRSVTRVLLATAGGLLIARGLSGLSVRQMAAFRSQPVQAPIRPREAFQRWRTRHRGCRFVRFVSGQ